MSQRSPVAAVPAANAFLVPPVSRPSSPFVAPKLPRNVGRFPTSASSATEAIESSSSSYDPVSDWVPPPPDVVRRTAAGTVGPMKALTSPVFFSTDGRTGRRVRGLSRVPSPSDEGGEDEGRALLFVSNHQLVGIDSWMVASELITERSVHLRSLVHPQVPSPAFLETFGALKVSPRTFHGLMQSGQPTLLFPGGAKESFHGRDGAYKLDAWPDGKADFVRVAAKFDATIVPFSSTGAAESGWFLADPPDLADATTPFGVAGAAFADLLGKNAPFNARYDGGGEAVTFPLVLPKPLPSRHYFLFHEPIRLTSIDHRDRDECRVVYETVKSRICEGIDDLLRAGTKDPYRDDSVGRILYERVWQKQAPTFPLDELN